MTSSLTIFMRGVVLFFVGVSFFWFCEALQNISEELSSNKLVLSSVFLNQLWIPICCGIASGKKICTFILLVLVGLLSPCIDWKLGVFDVYNNEWSSVLRCIALFLGFGHATARIEFATYFQLLFTIIGLSIGLWWVFDGSSVGLGFGMMMALIGTFIGQSCFSRSFPKFSHPTILAWLPCLFFSGGVAVVLVGRQLAKADVLALIDQKSK